MPELKEANIQMFPGCCAFTVVHDFDNIIYNKCKSDWDKDKVKKEVLRLCKKPSFSMYTIAPAGTFATLTEDQLITHRGLITAMKEMGFKKVMPLTTNPNGRRGIWLYYREYPRKEVTKVEATVDHIF